MSGRRQKILYAAAALAVLGYLAWPYASIFGFYQALKSADREAVEAAVAWPSVRAGMRADLNARARAAITRSAGRKLGPGGAVTGLRLSWDSAPLVDRIVDVLATPEGLIAMFREPQSLDCFAKALFTDLGAPAIEACRTSQVRASPAGNKDISLRGPNLPRIWEKTNWVFFTSPFSFKFDVLHENRRIVLLLERMGTAWKVVRISMPTGTAAKSRP
ncbi:MAG: DUF2939 domain-containing protein [Rhodospirillales bacterium]|jgi:hypothetical protein|nr:hypothetical protein [Rhodospirillaceae bacterium]MDP6429113.1 DUF2939 domain-containing protein [Rhodospirillales bacterium]MDP6645703.1 DUF2939 domain-containing protein [Rhodospirillales bacterium]MDP6842513.1 DUF2939 domain-containing protein [Rhodospirillales bacterium]|tara:strand:+ start:2639 stop:3289 length:651 start_codon:yes stop_codon:yes gene_type:complete